MKQECYTLPQMRGWPDVTRVTRSLRAIPGVVDVLASATFHQIVVQYDNTLTSGSAISNLLIAMGFSPVAENMSAPYPNGEVFSLSN